MANRIEAALKDGVRDPRGERIKREIEHFLHLEVEEVRTLDVYTLDTDLSKDELEQAAAGPFSDPVIQLWSIDRPLAAGFDFAVEVGFRPGVTDNVGRTAREAVAYLTGRPSAAGEGVYYSVQYLLKGKPHPHPNPLPEGEGVLSMADVEKIATGLLCNTLIQRYSILSAADFAAKRGFRLPCPRSAVKQRPRCGKSIWKFLTMS